MESADVLADDVEVRWPPLREARGIVREADTRHVVDEGVEPDVHRVVGGDLGTGSPISGSVARC